MKKKNTSILLIAVVIAALAFSGCGPTHSSDSSNTASESAGAGSGSMAVDSDDDADHDEQKNSASAKSDIAQGKNGTDAVNNDKDEAELPISVNPENGDSASAVQNPSDAAESESAKSDAADQTVEAKSDSIKDTSSYSSIGVYNTGKVVQSNLSPDKPVTETSASASEDISVIKEMAGQDELPYIGADDEITDDISDISSGTGSNNSGSSSDSEDGIKSGLDYNETPIKPAK